MAKSSNLLKQAPKKKKRKTQADVDAQHIGYEPEWSSADPIQESGVQSKMAHAFNYYAYTCLLYTSPSPRDATLSRMPSSG